MSTTMSAQEISDWTGDLTSEPWRFQKGWSPLAIAAAEGCCFFDGSGKRYLDFSSQLMCVNLGRSNKAVIAAIEEQARTLPYAAPGYATAVRC